MQDKPIINIVGGGLAGTEAAWQAANAGARVILHEMRPTRGTDAHRTDGLAELVCSNSFRSDDANANAVGLIHQEMRRCNSLVMASADANQVPAGGALAVDRDGFSAAITKALREHPDIEIRRGEVTTLPGADDGLWIFATGPLTSDGLAAEIAAATGADELAFFDAIAPIVHRESIDMDKAWFQSRYDKAGPGGTGADYLNCPMDEAQYNAFVDALLAAEQVEFKEWEKNTPYFDGCLPIEEMAARGRETLRHGPMKPVGLTNPHPGTSKSYAVVQLRQDNKLGTLWNMVGFQTKMRYGAQADIFRMIPGLENAEFARLGGLHRNTYMDSPRLLDTQLRLRSRPHLRFAGQMTGVEGYVESSACGLMAGRFAAAEAMGCELANPPPTTALGALLNHVTGGHISAETVQGQRSFQPMNVNFGLFPPLDDDWTYPLDENGRKPKGKAKSVARRHAMTDRARADLKNWLDGESGTLAAAE
ncbi:methylenetetrahydrofolate--tRNA-(uracil(54)-C(5))-methyltransferase (FADH(2)-oxidizing) TrmFO [Tepidamorphus sp. 3E244]|uniref:methylenetetrahydrofolate--tRNA-(uracil(54)- C(5))-methyltransferase (FADH(2)-oxidizing) TrmFO n=1 Tax=Tepidamorphus sp. 3E244 TaxID=3385498 RepID=UPI0038FD0EB4